MCATLLHGATPPALCCLVTHHICACDSTQRTWLSRHLIRYSDTYSGQNCKKKDKSKDRKEEKYLGAITYTGGKREKYRTVLISVESTELQERGKRVFGFIKNNGTEDIPALKNTGVYRIKCEEYKIVIICLSLV